MSVIRAQSHQLRTAIFPRSRKWNSPVDYALFNILKFFFAIAKTLSHTKNRDFAPASNPIEAKQFLKIQARPEPDSTPRQLKFQTSLMTIGLTPHA